MLLKVFLIFLVSTFVLYLLMRKEFKKEEKLKRIRSKS